MQLKKNLGIITLILIFTSCGDTEFCECIKAGDKLNDQSNKILNGENSQEAYVLQQELLEEKRNACRDYENTDGETLRKLQEECKE